MSSQPYIKTTNNTIDKSYDLRVKKREARSNLGRNNAVDGPKHHLVLVRSFVALDTPDIGQNAEIFYSAVVLFHPGPVSSLGFPDIVSIIFVWGAATVRSTVPFVAKHQLSRRNEIDQFFVKDLYIGRARRQRTIDPNRIPIHVNHDLICQSILAELIALVG